MLEFDFAQTQTLPIFLSLSKHCHSLGQDTVVVVFLRNQTTTTPNIQLPFLLSPKKHIFFFVSIINYTKKRGNLILDPFVYGFYNAKLDLYVN